MPLSTSPTFEMEKVKRQASEDYQKMDGYTYEDVLLAVRSRQDSQRYIRQEQRPQIFVQQMTISHELSSKVANFYSKQKWETRDLKKVVDHVAKLLNDGSKRKFQPLEKTTSLKHIANDIESFPYEAQEELQSRQLTQSWVSICDVIILVFGWGIL